jgi:uncharacterized alpha-E superfamily protein
MLSRVADALYWMARYVERAEHAARVLDVTQATLMDLEEVDPERARIYRANAMDQVGIVQDADWTAAIFDDKVLGSVASAVVRARENARQVRDVISPEMWDGLNRQYWALNEAARSGLRREFLSSVLEEVTRSSFLWSGVTDATMSRGTGWMFIRLGQYVERTDRVARTFARLWPVLHGTTAGSGGQSAIVSGPRGVAGDGPSPDDNLGWLLLLRSCGALEEYRKRHPTRFETGRIMRFLLLDPAFPRTVRYTTRVASSFAERIAAQAGARGASTQRAFGRLAAEVEYVEVNELLREGPEQLLEKVRQHLGRATSELQEAFFLH